LIRFANAFGFSGFNEMKQMFKQHLMEETANYTERARLFRQTTSDESSPPETPTEILNMFTMVNNQALQQLAMQTSSDDLERAVALLGEAENIYVIGLRRSFSVASYLTYALRHLDRKAFLIDGLGGMFTEQLSLVGPKDVGGGELLAVRPGSGRAGGAGRAAQSAADRDYRQPGQPAGGLQRCLLCGA
jgi:DNA-binding MurR/RpiR family transcriptional regulator